MIEFFSKLRLKKSSRNKIWSQALEPGSSMKKAEHHNRELAVFMAAFILLGLFSSNEAFESAIAAPQNAGYIQAGYYTGAERKNIRHFVRSNPDSLLRMSGQDIALVLNEPELVRQDYPTVVWQYRGDNCVLDVYFASMEEDVSEAPIVHYEIRSREKNMEDEAVFKGCIGKLMRPGKGFSMAKASSFYKKPYNH